MIHPKKGSPSGRNAYPVTEKMEELKKEEKNDMAKKKTFQEYTQEALLEIEKTEAALKQAKLEKEQAEHSRVVQLSRHKFNLFIMNRYM